MSKSSAASMPQSRLDGILSQKTDTSTRCSTLRSTGRQGCASLTDRASSRRGRGKIAWTAAYPREIFGPGHRERSWVCEIPPTSGDSPTSSTSNLPSHCQANIEHMTRTFTALALALSATSALAQGYNRQDLVRGMCQKDGCDEFTILAADRIRVTEEGALFKTRLKTFHASHAGRKDQGEENGYVLPGRPSWLSRTGRPWLSFSL